jgi:serine/threonine protein kinase
LGDSETVSEGDCSEWTVEADQSRDDLYVGTSPQRRPRTLVALGKHRSEQQQQINDYRYQICLYVQMQLCKPSTLADWIRSRNQATEQSLVSDRINNVSEIFQQIAQGLEHVHAKGIVHRDLKPANVFATCGEGLHFKIGDFGLSKQIAANVTRSGSTCPKPVPTQSLELAITQQNEASWNDPLTAGVGTASYAAPEQVATRNYGTEADVYSFGLILLELLSSFSTEHERMQTFSDCRHRRELPRELVRYFPIAADTILACTEPSPLIRPKAYDLARLDLTNGRGAVPQSPSTEVCSLRQALVQKDEEIESLKQQLGEKQQTIDAMISNGTHKPAYWMLPQSVPEQGLIGISNSLFVNGGNAALHSGPASSNSSSSSEGDL